MVDNVKNGTWVGGVETSDEGAWGERISLLFSYNKEELKNRPNLEFELVGLHFDLEFLNFDGGVDSGQFGFFDFEHYRNGNSAKDLTKYDFGDDYDIESGDVWYRAVCNITLASDQWGVTPNGIVSSSGFGDGSYPSYGLKDSNGQYIAFVTIFIGGEFGDDEE